MFHRLLHAAALLLAGSLSAAVSVQGWMTSPAVTGDPSAGVHRWDREIVYLTPMGSTPGPTCGMRMLAIEPGWFLIKPPEPIAPGRYRLFTINLGNVDGGTVGFQYRADPVVVTAEDGELEDVLIEPASHYTAMFNRHYEEWAKAPWVWGSNFHQTFVATSPSVTRLATKLAGKDAGPGTHHLNLTLNVALYEAGDGPPSAWKRVSPIRERHLPGTMDPIIHVLDVNYLHAEVSLTPGKHYAYRLWVKPGSECTRFAVVARPKMDKGYPRGRAFRDDEALDWDLYGHVAAGAPGAIETLAPVDQEKPMNGQDLLGTRTAHGQTFVASGHSLAAVELLYTIGCNPNPPRRVTLSLHHERGGPPIGPARSCLGVTDVCQGRVAAMWEPGEVPLVPGQSYFLHVDSAPDGINVWSLNGDIPGGDAHVGESRVAGKDLTLTVVEWEGSDLTK